MSQHDFNIANQTASNARSDLNNALSALASLSSGATPPSTTYANMLWYDTSTNFLKVRDESDSGWIPLLNIAQGLSIVRLVEDTGIANSDGTIRNGKIGFHDTSVWEEGTATGERLVSPFKMKAAIEALASSEGFDSSQTWQDVSGSRSASTSYQNTTGRTICVNIQANGADFEVSDDNATWVNVANLRNYDTTVVIPNNYYYRTTGGTITLWAELR